MAFTVAPEEGESGETNPNNNDASTSFGPTATGDTDKEMRSNREVKDEENMQKEEAEETDYLHQLQDQIEEQCDLIKDVAGDGLDTVKHVAGDGLDTILDFYGDWKKFALRKNIFDVTIGIVIGSGITKICTSLTEDVFYPLVVSSWSGSNLEEDFLVLKPGLSNLTRSGGCENCYKTIEEAQSDGAVTLNYGRFIDSITSFLFTTLILFCIYKYLGALQKRVAEELEELGLLPAIEEKEKSKEEKNEKEKEKGDDEVKADTKKEGK